MGAVYLLHYERGLLGGRNRHYTGWTAGDPERRITEHRAGKGSAFAREMRRQGIGFEVAGVWSARDTADERYLKSQKNAPRYCPICRGRPDVVFPRVRPPRPDASQSPGAARTGVFRPDVDREAIEENGALYVDLATIDDDTLGEWHNMAQRDDCTHAVLGLHGICTACGEYVSEQAAQNEQAEGIADYYREYDDGAEEAESRAQEAQAEAEERAASEPMPWEMADDERYPASYSGGRDPGVPEGY